MGKRILITAGDVSVEALLNDSPCASAIWDALPIECASNTWGNEIYFNIGVNCPLADDASDELEVGELGYWPPGRAFCIFFGPTPMSEPDGKPRAAGDVNHIGRIAGDASSLRFVVDGVTVRLSAID